MDLGQFQSKKQPKQSRAEQTKFIFLAKDLQKGSEAGGKPLLLLQSAEPEIEMGQVQCSILELLHKYQCTHHFKYLPKSQLPILISLRTTHTMQHHY